MGLPVQEFLDLFRQGLVFLFQFMALLPLSLVFPVLQKNLLLLPNQFRR
jgi:hypothetical protein